MVTALWGADGLDDVAEWVEAFGLTFPVLHDQDDQVFTLYAETTDRPQYFLLDRELTVVGQYVGRDGHEEAKAATAALLAQ